MSVRSGPGADPVAQFNPLGVVVPSLPDLVKILVMETRISSFPDVTKHGRQPQRSPRVLRPPSPFQEIRGLRDTHLPKFTQPVVLVLFHFLLHLTIKHIGIVIDVYSLIGKAVCPQRVELVHHCPGPRVHNRWRSMGFENIAGAKSEQPPDLVGRVANHDAIEGLEEVMPVKRNGGPIRVVKQKLFYFFQIFMLIDLIIINFTQIISAENQPLLLLLKFF
jgi:hypothetical protein